MTRHKPLEYATSPGRTGLERPVASNRKNSWCEMSQPRGGRQEWPGIAKALWGDGGKLLGKGFAFRERELCLWSIIFLY